MFAHEKPKVTLSCLQCQQRKRKCDKSNPCQACRQAGLSCTAISRARLPRGRHAQRDGDLRQRVARLEKLVSSQRSGAEPAQPTPAYTGSESLEFLPESSWSSITEEVAGIREILDDLAGDGLDDPPNESPATSPTRTFNILLFGDISCFVQPDILESPPTTIISALIDVYLQRIDPVFKVIHVPSLQEIFDETGVSPAKEALKFAMFFTAVNSLNEEECVQMLKSSKAILSSRFRLATEIQLSRAGLLSTTGLTTLQAFVIYLAGLRTCKGGRDVCALLAVAVRLGQSLSLDLETATHPPFVTEMRRRVWFAIGVLDMRVALDSGSYPALSSGALFKIPPSHVNDTDISPEDLAPPLARLAFTDMTFSSATHEMMRYMQKMINVPLDAGGRPLMQQTWAQRYAIVENCTRALDQKFVVHCNTADDFQRFTKIVCSSMTVTLRLLVRRPMYRFYSAEPPPNDDFNVLDVAMDVLDQALQKGETTIFKRYEWFGWIKWYALAVLLAELCEHTKGQRIDRAWMIAEASYAKYSETVYNDALWASMKRLMRKARFQRARKNSAAEAKFGDKSVASVFPGPQTLDLPTEHETTHTFGLEPQGYNENVWDEQEISSWVNWESFVQNLGTPPPLDTTNGFY